MRWLAQVAHVAAKDLRQARSLVLAYLAVVGIAAAHAVGLLGRTSQLELAMPLVVVVGVMLVATFMQADSAVRSDAFWASRPFHSSAVVAAKIATIGGVVLGAGVLGQAIALSAISLDGPELAAMLGASVLVYGLWLLAAALLAALTPDLRSFVVSVVSVAAAVSLAAVALPTRDLVIQRPTHVALLVLAVTASAAFLFWLYATRDTRYRAKLEGLASVGLIIAALMLPISERLAHASDAGSAGSTASADAQLNVTIEPRRSPSDVTLRLAVRPAHEIAHRRVTFAPAFVTLTLRDGRKIRLDAQSGDMNFLPRDSTRAGYQMLSAPQQGCGEWSVVFLPTGPERDAIRAGIARLTLDGAVTVSSPRTLGSMPLQAGATLSTNRSRLTITSVSPSRDNVDLEVASSSLPVRGWTTDERSYGESGSNLVLVNETRREMVALVSRNSQNSGTMLVVPGISRNDQRRRYVIEGDTTRVDAAWLRAARVLVTRWERESRSAARASATFPASGASAPSAVTSADPSPTESCLRERSSVPAFYPLH